VKDEGKVAGECNHRIVFPFKLLFLICVFLKLDFVICFDLLSMYLSRYRELFFALGSYLI